MNKWKDKTRNGTPVRIYAEDGKPPRIIHGAYKCVLYGDWASYTWLSDGRESSKEERPIDLIPNTPDIDWSKQPAWCKAIARNILGFWMMLDYIPTISIDGLSWSSDPKRDDWHCVKMHPSEYPDWDGDWKYSLCVRPEGGGK